MLPTVQPDDDQALVIQREVGRMLRRSFEAVAREPLPEQVAILLLRLALAESLSVLVDDDQAEGKSKGLARRRLGFLSA